MSHHSEEALTFLMSKEQREKYNQDKKQRADIMRQFFDSEVGATGKFPDGKVAPQDEGELRYGLTIFNGTVVFDFGKPIRSLGLESQQARELALILANLADDAEKQIKVRIKE